MTFIKHSNLSEAASRPDAAIVRINHDRQPTMITLSTWKALFLREAVSRLSAGRAAWLWLLLEPVLHVTYILVIYTAIHYPGRSAGGAGSVLLARDDRTGVRTRHLRRH